MELRDRNRMENLIATVEVLREENARLRAEVAQKQSNDKQEGTK